MTDQKIFYQKHEEFEENQEQIEASVLSGPVIVLAAGGTGGHVMPAISIGQILTEKGFTVFYVTDQRGFSYFEQHGIDPMSIVQMPFTGLGEKSLHTMFPIFKKMVKGILTCRKFFKQTRPSLILGFGGYPTFPPLTMASVRKIPFILYEPDSYLGVVNRFFAKHAKIIGTGFETVQNIPKKVVQQWTGMPVRSEFKQLRNSVSESSQKFTICIVGGSQGAAIFSTVIPQAIALLPVAIQQKIQITQHIRGELKTQTQDLYAQTQAQVTLETFFPDIWQHMHHAELVISRAGASTIAEILMLGKPALLVPYKYALNDHQKMNASVLVQKQAAWMLEENQFTPEDVAKFLQKIIENAPERQQVARQARVLAQENAAEQLAQLVIDCL